MIGVDTNVLVRYLTQDEPKQAAAATRFFEAQLSDRTPGFVSLVVLVELYWVLERLYHAEPREIIDTVADMLAMAHFHFQEHETVQAALDDWQHLENRGKVGLPELLIAKLALRFGCARVMSFDKTAVSSAGMTLLE